MFNTASGEPDMSVEGFSSSSSVVPLGVKRGHSVMAAAFITDATRHMKAIFFK